MTDGPRERELDLHRAACHFMEQADARVVGAGDFDAYHSARHDLSMALDAALSDCATSDADRLGTSCPIGPESS